MLRRVLPLLAVLALVAAPAARADDNGVYQAWIAHDAKFERLAEKIRATERSSRTRRQKATRIIALIDDMREVLAENTTGVRAQEPSSEKGTEAKALALKSNARVDASVLNTRKGLRLFLDGASQSKIDRYLRRGRVLIKEASAYAKRARTAFKEAGVSVG
ncbi:MAG: hypothetical protein M3340_09870 [Actinomycetota bacterium]|nr:hypothetical protein [Actinomycetota bacterium]